MVKIKVKKKVSTEEYVKMLIDKFGISKLGFDLVENEDLYNGRIDKYTGQRVEFDEIDNSYDYSISLNTARTSEIPKIKSIPDDENHGYVMVEEEITENTIIPRLIEFDDCKFDDYEECSIAELKNSDSKAFYMLNDDMTMTLIWKDGEMVE
ncbi:hypothetical protein [uncultured Staphylococcus sp.]|uniref:hypothetical protein n=1 Tax=uncultured Staphylococcus sp. TaxID=189668 RepID=UPI0025D99C4D|nr:hypothetical protein [uncultured Staphylococcus sp.]